MKRLISLGLALLMVAAITGCGGRKRQPVELTLSTEDSEAIMRAAGVQLPEADVAPGAGTTVQWFGWSDPYQAYSETEIVNTGFWTFKNKYSGEFKFVETTFEKNQDDLANLIQYATNDAMLNLSIYMTDNDEIAISVVPMNAVYGMLGYMQASYVQSNNLLMTVINLFGIRNWLFIFAGVGAVLIIAGGVLRECGKRTRERTEIARDRIIRANTTPEGKLPEDEKKAAKKAAKDAKKGKHDEAPTADKGAAPVGRPAPRPGAPRPARRPQK